MTNQKGQAVIETAISSLMILLVFKILFYTFIFLWMKIWSEFNLQESLVCRESQKSHRYCSNHFNQKIKQAQILFRVQKVQWKRSLNQQSATLTVQDFLGFRHVFSKKIEVNAGKPSFSLY